MARDNAKRGIYGLAKRMALQGGWEVSSRTDVCTMCFKHAKMTGPDWKQVRGHATVNMHSGGVIAAEDSVGLTRDRERRHIDRNTTLDIQTLLRQKARCVRDR